MARASGFVDRLTRHYDKFIAGGALLALVLALGYLAVEGASQRHREQVYEQELGGIQPAHPRAQAVDLQPYARALAALENPYRIAVDSNHLAGFLVPEARVWCIDCRLPISYLAETCPFCKTSQPKPPEIDPEHDTDGGGIPDLAEIRYGLNKFDPADDVADSDGDGFSNLTEHRAGTDPLDPDDHPDLDVELRVKSIVGRQLPMKFMGTTTMPDGKKRSQINLAGANARTVWVDPGQQVGDSDFTFARLEARTERRFDPKTSSEREFDVSRAILERDGKEFVLVVGQDTVYTDFDIVFVLPLDGSEYKAVIDGTFKMRGSTYRVIKVDTTKQSVVIRDDLDGKEIDVPKLQ